jgi:hypothetical protein
VNSKQTLKPAALTLLLLLLPGAHTASAQSVRRLRLVRGATSVSGVLRPGTREARHAYTFRAKAGQRLSARVTSGRVSMGEGGGAAAVFHVTYEAGNLPPDFGDYPYGGPTEWAGALPRDGLYKVTVSVEDGPDDPDEATLRRMKLSLRYRLKVTLR